METDRTRVAFIAMEKTGVPVSLSGLSVTFTWRCQVAAGYEYNVQGEMQGLKIAIPGVFVQRIQATIVH